MVKVFLTYDGRRWKESYKGDPQKDFWIHEKLLNQLKKLNKIRNDGWDGLIIVDGRERVGKSVLGMACGWYLSNTKMNINNFSEGIGDMARKIATLPDKSILVLDEAGTTLSSSDAMTKWQKNLINILEIVGQKNMVFILCLPRFFKLKSDIAVDRALFLLHVYPRKKDWKRGQFVYFSEEKKRLLYYHGKKNYGSYSYPKANWNGEFMDFEPPFYKEYKEITKKNSLQRVLEIAMDDHDLENPRDVRQKIENETYYKLKELFNLTTKDLTKLYGHSVRTINEKVQKYKMEHDIE